MNIMTYDKSRALSYALSTGPWAGIKADSDLVLGIKLAVGYFGILLLLGLAIT